MYRSTSPSLSASKNFAPKPSGRNEELEARPHGGVLEHAVPVVHVERVQLLGEVRDEEIREAVAVDVGAIDAHARLRLAVLIESDARRRTRRRRTAVAVVAIQEIPHRVVRDVDVHVAVAIEVAERDAEPLAGRIRDAGRSRDIGERAVAVVAKEAVGLAVEERRVAIGAIARLPLSAVRLSMLVS